MKIAVFCSGRGTNLQAIIEAVKCGEIKAEIALVISDNRDAYALVRAKEAGIETLVIEPKDFPTRKDFEKEIIKHLERKKIDLICLAGFMRMLSPDFVQRYRNRILNIHPALLPSFKGTQGVKDALEYGVKITGPTVHFVDEKVDHGPIILQAAVEVRDDDTEETLAERIHQEEHRIYPQAIKLFVEGRLKIEGRRVKILNETNNK
ncbi:MAG: phosphoribosylglycinamide formyltransferase [Candidatus Omnitrophica bacterium]|nr:phosphoribosylglycinamide formyltransferase [Candidatus Omnitrophota bacterium]MCM8793139.1 phosphoribosylglycinamide formyltransferase [Candidatus Omnitrophota bacterium]